MKVNLLYTLALGCFAITATAQTIISESFNYALGSGPFDASGGLNGGSGLPFDNTGGNPAGSGTGLRSNWSGSSGTTVAGLSYAGLTSSGNAIQATAGFGGRNAVYRNMTTDPFLTLRQGSSSANFGNDGNTLWFSFLMQTDTVGDGVRSSIRIGQSGSEFGIGVNAVGVSGGSASQFTMEMGSLGIASGSNLSGVTAMADTTYLLVGSINFLSGGDEINWWINPTIGGTLGSADLSVTTTNSLSGFQTFQTRIDGASVIFDELRMGTSFADVTPVTVVPEPSAYAVIAGALGLALVAMRRRK